MKLRRILKLLSYINDMESPGTIISDHKKLSVKQKFFAGCLLVVSFLLIISAWWLWQGGIYHFSTTLREEKLASDLKNDLLNLVSNPRPFIYVIVPNATSELSIPAPEAQTVEELSADYQEALSQLPEVLPEKDSIADFMVNDVRYEEYINALPSRQREIFFQIHEEVKHLTSYFSQQYSVVPLVGRIGTSTVARYLDSTIVDETGASAVYPSLRVVEAYVVAGLLSRQFPDQVMRYEALAEDYAERGVGYGQYSYREAAVARQLAFDYLANVPIELISPVSY